MVGNILSTERPAGYHHDGRVERSLVCVEGRGRISQSGLTKDIKMGSCVFQCNGPSFAVYNTCTLL